MWASTNNPAAGDLGRHGAHCSSDIYAVYDLKYFQALPFGLFEFEDI